jgi:hypothetical protein
MTSHLRYLSLLVRTTILLLFLFMGLLFAAYPNGTSTGTDCTANCSCLHLIDSIHSLFLRLWIAGAHCALIYRPAHPQPADAPTHDLCNVAGQPGWPGWPGWPIFVLVYTWYMGKRAPIYRAGKAIPTGMYISVCSLRYIFRRL